MRRERKRRKHFRVEWNSPATIYYLNRRVTRRCIVRNFSNGGAKIVGVKATTMPDEFLLCITQATVAPINAACSGVPMMP
jgi:hypothetical protein